MTNDLTSKLSMLDDASVAIIGDVCLDYYIDCDMRLSVLSRETPEFPMPVVSERYSAGGAANTACNAAALKPASLTLISAIGTDWRGDMLIRTLSDAGIDTSNVIRDERLTTNTYLKPMRHGISDVVYESARIDFEQRSPIPSDIEDRLLEKLESADCNVLIAADQMKYGCITDRIREKINALGASGRSIIVDSRDRIDKYRNVIVKPNETEALRFGMDIFDKGPEIAAERISAITGAPVIITLGSSGSVLYDGACTVTPAIPVSGPVDTVGAGDTFISAAACALAAGMPLSDAVKIATAASAVTVRKLGTTGTASRDEIISMLGR